MVGRTVALSEQEAAALVRVGLLTMLFDLSQVFGFDFDCHVVRYK
jgi:hypothetical protein